jgi:hypothetical protein
MNIVDASVTIYIMFIVYLICYLAYLMLRKK